MSGKSYKDRDVDHIVERQMSHWELSRTIQDKSDQHAHLAGGAEIDYITISRDFGSGGEEIARILSDIMKWDVYDKEILDYMSEHMDVHVKALESVDERTIGWINDWLLPLFSSKGETHIEQLSYYKHLGKVLLVIAKHGRAIIMGRAAGHVLPRDKGLSVRITAPFEVRCYRYAKENDLSVVEAASIIKKADEAKRKFVKNFVGVDLNDARNYDIVLNTEKISPVSVAKLIWRAFDQRVESQQDKVEAKSKGHDITKIVEHQMQQWQQESNSRDESEKHAHLAGGGDIDYITISRELGSGGKEIARMLADLMQWQLYDKEILDYMAENMKIHVQLLTSIDERTRGWIGDQLVPFFTKKSATHIKQLRYYEHLGEVLLIIANHGRAIIVGRGAGQVLPREKGLSVHVTAPLELRCNRIAKLHKISINEATTIVKRADKEQSKFVKDFLGTDISDVKHYDIICNTEKIYPRSMAKLIYRAFEERVISEKAQGEESNN